MVRVRGMLLCALVLSGCAAFVDKADYADYRNVRLAEDDGERLLAIRAYVGAHPDGHWAEELRAEQAAREVAVYEDGKDTRDGLELYLRAYPEGQFKAQAQARLTAMTQVEARRTEERAAAERAAADKRARDEELRRTWVTRFSSYWVETLLAVRQWGEPIADIARLNPDFSRAFGKSPRPQCSTTECVKHYRSSFGVPVPGGNRLERVIELMLRLSLRDGRVARVELLFPRRGFSRWFELENRRTIVDEDPQMRGEAIAWAMDKVKPWLAALGEPRSEVTNLVFDPVLAPTLGPNGEVTDTTAADPSSQVQGASAEVTAPVGSVPEATIPVPATDQPAPDMVIGPIVIPEQGHRVQSNDASTPPAAPSAEGGGEIMTLGPIEAGPTPVQAGETPSGEGETMTLGAIDVGGGDGAPPTPAVPTASTQALPLQTYALSSGDLRVVVFAESAGGWDGVRIERVVSTPAAAKPATHRTRGR